MMASLEEKKGPTTVDVTIIGKHGAGKSTLLKALAPEKISEEREETTSKKLYLLMESSSLTEGKRRNKEAFEWLSKHHNTDLFVYCLSVDPDVKFSYANPSIMWALQEVFGKKVWKKCILALTFSNKIWERIERKNKQKSAAIFHYKKYIYKYANLFQEELAKLGVCMSVRPAFDLDLVPDSQPTILALPVGNNLDDLVLPDIRKITDNAERKPLRNFYTKNWTDLVMIEMDRKYKAILKEKQRSEGYKKAIKEKVCVDICPVKMNYIGLPQSGKTTFQLRLTNDMVNILSSIAKGEMPPPSTGVAEHGGQFVVGNKTVDSWGAISKGWSVFKNLKQEAGVISEILHEAAEKASKLKTDLKEQDDDFPAMDYSPAELLCPMVTASAKITSPCKSPSSVFSDDDLEDLYDVINEAVEEEDWDKVKLLLDDMILLISTNTGGQAEFLDLQASLVQGPSFNLLFRRLVDRLESQYEVSYINKDGISTEKEYSLMTVEDVLFQSLAVIAGFSDSADNQEADTDITNSPPKSKALIVGTFEDQVSPEEFKREDELLQQKIKKTKFYERGVIEFASEHNLMLPVNNMSGGQEDMDQARTILEKVIRRSFEKVSIPASWLVLSLQIRSKKANTITLKECKKMARKLKIDPSELPDALLFLHNRVGVLLYFPNLEALKDTVICNIQIVFDSASNLILNVFTFDKVGKAVSEKFREKGQFSLKDVKKATSGNTDCLLSLEKLIQLLEYLNVLTTMPSSEASQEPTYFMPCVLRSAKVSELICIHGDQDPSPLMLHFNCGYVPIGMFPSLIANLASKEVECWEMIQEGIRKNKVQFHVGGDYDTVTLISRPRYLEIVVTRSKNFRASNEELCPYICKVIDSTLGIVTSHMRCRRFSMGYKYAFECPTHPGREHLCVVANEKAIRMKCLQDERHTIPLEPLDLVWFSSRHQAVSLSVSTLTLLKWKDEYGQDKAFRLINSVSSEWMNFGLRLDIEINQLKAWEKQYHENANRCCVEVMDHWLKTGGTMEYPTTWDGLYELLKDVECEHVIENLKEAVRKAPLSLTKPSSPPSHMHQ